MTNNRKNGVINNINAKNINFSVRIYVLSEDDCWKYIKNIIYNGSNAYNNSYCQQTYFWLLSNNNAFTIEIMYPQIPIKKKLDRNNFFSFVCGTTTFACLTTT
eukprot:743428_1